MKKLVHGVGVNDADYLVIKCEWVEVSSGKQMRKITWFCPFFRRWTDMIARCYSRRLHATRPTYIGCAVCDEWLTFSNFKAWMEQQDWEGKELDKDLMVSGNKIYSPETCLFVPKLINTFITGDKGVGGRAEIEGRYRSSCANPITGKKEYLGAYDNPELANQAYRKRKHEIVMFGTHI